MPNLYIIYKIKYMNLLIGGTFGVGMGFISLLRAELERNELAQLKKCEKYNSENETIDGKYYYVRGDIPTNKIQALITRKIFDLSVIDENDISDHSIPIIPTIIRYNYIQQIKPYVDKKLTINDIDVTNYSKIFELTMANNQFIPSYNTDTDVIIDNIPKSISIEKIKNDDNLNEYNILDYQCVGNAITYYRYISDGTKYTFSGKLNHKKLEQDDTILSFVSKKPFNTIINEKKLDMYLYYGISFFFITGGILIGNHGLKKMK